MEKDVEVVISKELYDEVCCSCSDVDGFCVDAVKRFIDRFPVD